MLSEQFDAFTKKHYDKIMKRLEVEEDVLKEAIDEVVKLNPKPGNSRSDTARVVQHVVPDFLLVVDGDELQIQTQPAQRSELRVSPMSTAR